MKWATEPDQFFHQIRFRSFKTGSVDPDPFKWDRICNSGFKYCLLGISKVGSNTAGNRSKYTLLQVLIPSYKFWYCRTIWDLMSHAKSLNNSYKIRHNVQNSEPSNHLQRSSYSIYSRNCPTLISYVSDYISYPPILCSRTYFQSSCHLWVSDIYRWLIDWFDAGVSFLCRLSLWAVRIFFAEVPDRALSALSASIKISSGSGRWKTY